MDLSSLLGGEGGGGLDPSAFTSGITQILRNEGGVEGLTAKLRAAGLGSTVDSWIGTGSNTPVAPDQLGQALGPQTLAHLTGATGLSIEQLLPILSSVLPMIVDHLTPGGSLPAGGGVGDVSGLGGLLGGIVGSGGLGGILGQK